jgi:hypothetical protein
MSVAVKQDQPVLFFGFPPELRLFAVHTQVSFAVFFCASQPGIAGF